MKKLVIALLLTLTLLPSAGCTAEGEEQPEALRVAVIDTGVSTTAVAPEQILPGCNYIRPEEDTQDKLGHGTAVCAIIAGSESARVEGICPEAKLVPLVTATRDEAGEIAQGDTRLTARAILDAVDVYGCRIINISSGAASSSYQLRSAVEHAQSRGALVISCAGNNQKSDPGAICWPGGYDSVLCVGAVNEDGSVASYSQQNDTVDLLALGSMWIATPKGTRIRGEGTSYATAVVTGAAALIWSRYPELTADEVRSAVLACTQTVNGVPVADIEAVSNWTP